MTPRPTVTVSLDGKLLQGAKTLAARTDRTVAEVLEAALRRYLVIEMLERPGDLTDDEGLAVSYRELRAMRRERDELDALQNLRGSLTREQTDEMERRIADAWGSWRSDP